MRGQVSSPLEKPVKPQAITAGSVCGYPRRVSPRPGDRALASAAGLLAGVLVDQCVGDPRRGHPVALFGRAAARLERRMWRDDRAAGGAYAALLVGGAVGLGLLLRRGSAPTRFAATAAGAWAVLGSRSLLDEAGAVRAHLSRGDLPSARRQLTHLVGRRTDELDQPEIARAVIESVAENTSDAVIAPLFWGSVAGLPGLLGYRAINTLDAMVGYHNPRYENFGWASARADDIANYIPARLAAVLTAVVAPLVGGHTREVVNVARRDGRRHPSPNAGVTEAAFAAALGVRLGGRNEYGTHVEERPLLAAHGRVAQAADVDRAVWLSRSISYGAAAVCAGVGLLRRRRR
jgi:adenosylcobinamide-phosphate synthase